MSTSLVLIANAYAASYYGHFRLRQRDGGHTIDPLYPKTPCYTQTSRLHFLQKRKYGRSKFYIAGIRIFHLFCCSCQSCDLDL